MAASNVIVTPEDPTCQYEYLEKWDDEQVRRAGQRHWESLQAQPAGSV